MTEVERARPRFRWPVAVALRIDAPADRVWEAISMPGNLEVCHPFCQRNPVEVWPGSESRDVIHYLSGWTYERRFRKWLDGVGYDLEIGEPGGRTSFVSWRITPFGERSCRLQISVEPHVLQHLPVVIRWLPHLAYVRPMLRRYLVSVVRGVEWYVTRGEPVARNQFGTHPWFS